MKENTRDLISWQYLTASMLDIILERGVFLTKGGTTDIFSSVIYHELLHVLPFVLLDVNLYERGLESFEWGACMDYTDSQSITNVQNHVLLAALAQLEQRKIRLSYDTAQAKAGQYERDLSLPLVS